MKKIIICTLLTLSTISSLSASCRSVTKAEAAKLNTAACKFFERIYENRVSMDIKTCTSQSKFSICENDPQYGTYIYGKLSTSNRTFDCNMSIVNQKIVDADCGDE